MVKFKLSATKDLFPDKEKKLEEQDRELNYGKMFRISEEEKKETVAKVIDMVDEFKRQREGLMALKEEAVKSYEGIEEIKGPWDGSSNISTMITTIASDAMHAKLMPMVYNPSLIHFIGTEKHDEDTAKNNEVLMRWALTQDMENTQDKVDDSIHRLIVDGTIAIKRAWEVYYTYVTRIVPKSVTSKGKVKYDVEYDYVKRQRARWIIKDIDYVYFTYNAENEQRADIIEEVYLTLPMLREMKERKMILPDVDLDDIKNHVEKNFDPGGTVKARMDALGLEAYHARLESYPIKCYEAYIKHVFKGDIIRKECIFLIMADEKKYLAGKPLHTVSRIGKKPWLIRPFLRRPGTMYGKGVPELVRHLHKEMNVIHNQRIDAGNMVLAPFFFYRAASGMEPEEITIKPATGIPLDDPQRDIYFPDYNPSRLSVSFQEESILMDLIEKLTYLTPAMLGRETADRPTARGTLAVIAQGEQKFGLLAARVQRIFTDLITATRQDYEENLPADIQKRILGKDGNPVWGELSPEMIAGQYDCAMELDLTSGDIAFEKQADQLIFQSLVQDPMVNNNPAYAWEIRAGYLKALGKKNIEKYIGPKPDMEVNEGDIEDENMMMFQEKKAEVDIAKDDHVKHMNAHAQFKREQNVNMTPNALRLLTVHILEHRDAYTTGLQEQAMMQGGGNGSQSGQAGMAGAPGASGVQTIQGPRVGGPGAVQPPGGPPQPQV